MAWREQEHWEMHFWEPDYKIINVTTCALTTVQSLVWSVSLKPSQQLAAAFSSLNHKNIFFNVPHWYCFNNQSNRFSNVTNTINIRVKFEAIQNQYQN